MMTMNLQRRYPVGIQTFEKIVKGGYVYIDKTDLMWNLTQMSNYVFLSRPRRFGKSLLSSTLCAYFEGRKDLFEGLKIMQMERQWERYPVLHLDLSVCKCQASAEALSQRIMLLLDSYSEIYGKKDNEKTPGGLLTGLIRRAFELTGKQVAVIIDEYDAPLIEVLHEEEVLPEFRRVMQEFYVPLKALDPYVLFYHGSHEVLATEHILYYQQSEECHHVSRFCCHLWYHRGGGEKLLQGGHSPHG